MELTRKKPCEKQVIELAFYVNIIIVLNPALTLQNLIIYLNVVQQVCCCHMLQSSGRGGLLALVGGGVCTTVHIFVLKPLQDTRPVLVWAVMLMLK